MRNLDSTVKRLIEFRDEREWGQFHNTKDLCTALSIEASELLEIFLWKSDEQFNIDKLKEELADVLSYALLIANKHNLDIFEIINDKIDANALKYPVSKSKGVSTKYNQL